MQNSVDALIISAHPDDAEMAMGGTLIKLSQAKLHLYHISLTVGDRGSHGNPEIRRQEFSAALRYLNADGEILDFQDTELENTLSARRRMATIIRTLKPRIIFAPYHTNPWADRGGISHTDHYAAGSIMRDAAKLARMRGASGTEEPHTVRRIYFYMIPNFLKPTVVVDVGDVLDKTFELISCHASQMAIARGGRTIEEILRAKRAGLGVDTSTLAAEPFIVDEPLHMTPQMFLDG